MNSTFPSFPAADRPLVLAISSRFLFPDVDKFWTQVKRIASSDIDAFILREKDLVHDDYLSFAKRFIWICKDNDILPILHSDLKAASELGCNTIQMPLPLLLQIEDRDLPDGKDQGEANAQAEDKALMPSSYRPKHPDLTIGTSVHSKEDALTTKRLPVSWLIASNIFPTDCKRGLPGRGLGFLHDMREIRPDIPIIALGGIDENNAESVVENGADGIAMMSGFMQADDPVRLVEKLKSL